MVTIVASAAKLGGVTLSERVKFTWERSGLSMRALSAAIGKSPDYIQKIIERGAKRPDIEALAALAAKVGVSEAWLIHGRGAVDDARVPELPTPEYDKSTSTAAELDELIRSARARATRERRTVHEFAWVELRRVLPIFSVGKVSVASAVEIAQAFSDDGIGKYSTPREETGPHSARPSKASGE